MADNPERSWAKMYTQMWNLALREPISKNSFHGKNEQNHNQQHNNNTGAQGGNVPVASGNWKDRCCWRFGKGSCKDGNNC